MTQRIQNVSMLTSQYHFTVCEDHLAAFRNLDDFHETRYTNEQGRSSYHRMMIAFALNAEPEIALLSQIAVDRNQHCIKVSIF